MTGARHASFFKLLFLIILYPAYTLAADSSPSLSGAVRVFKIGAVDDVKSERPYKNVYRLHFILYIKNTTNQVLKIPTSGFSASADGFEKARKTNLLWDFVRAPDGSGLVPSEAGLKIVNLRRNESATIEWQETEFYEERLALVGVAIDIKKGFAERFGIWFGTCSSENVKVYLDWLK